MNAIVERSFEVGTVSLNYARSGSGPPVILLHGGSSRWQHLESLVRELAERWHVYAPDLRGHGHSSHVPDHYRLTDYADDIVAFLERCRGPVAAGSGRDHGRGTATGPRARARDR